MPERVDEPGMGVLEVFPLDTSEDFLFGLCKDIFEHYWSSIHFGILIQGAVWEIRAPNAPTRISLYDGYLTVASALGIFMSVLASTRVAATIRLRLNWLPGVEPATLNSIDTWTMQMPRLAGAVSYTHLTLPTKRIV